MVSTLRRVRTEGPKRNQKVLAPSYGLRCAQVPSLRTCSVGTPPRAIHGPVAALPVSMPVDPLLSTSSRPPGRAGRSKTLRPEAADRPACSVRVYCAISVDTLLQVKPYCGSEPARERPSRAGSLPQLQCFCSRSLAPRVSCYKEPLTGNRVTTGISVKTASRAHARGRSVCRRFC